ncbi:IS3 family transposase [Streptomyces cahuitamycinicus]|uniref:IS3 family transposase n=1 Tax=Streptomyces cahuitamycinicus TaxID=2070367 RepID=UPI0015E13BF5|nr:IS3 family transposase [Streptomyces cahuitamycinicus]
MNRFQFVADHQRRYGVKRLCTILGIARSSFYYWRRTAADRAAPQAADAKLAARIRKVHQDSDGTYGAPSITAELREDGERVNHKRVARVMRRIGLAGLRLRRKHRTTIADPAAAKAADLISRDFTAAVVNTKYVGDITYLPLSGEFLYLATVIDLASRRLAGWAITDHMRSELVIDALAAAERCRGSLADAVLHTDHGSQYTSRAFADACRQAGVRAAACSPGSFPARTRNCSPRRATVPSGARGGDGQAAPAPATCGPSPRHGRPCGVGLARAAGGQEARSDAGRTRQALAALNALTRPITGAGSSDREVGELEVAEGDLQAVGAAAPVAEVGMPQRAGEDHQLLLLLARTGVPGGEQLPGYLSRQVLGDPTHPRIVQGPAAAANPNRALVRKAKPSASAWARRRARIRGCQRARTASSIARTYSGPAGRRAPDFCVTHLCTARCDTPRLRPPSGWNADVLPAETAGEPRCSRERAGCATPAPAPARYATRPPLQAASRQAGIPARDFSPPTLFAP